MNTEKTRYTPDTSRHSPKFMSTTTKTFPASRNFKTFGRPINKNRILKKSLASGLTFGFGFLMPGLCDCLKKWEEDEPSGSNIRFTAQYGNPQVVGGNGGDGVGGMEHTSSGEDGKEKSGDLADAKQIDETGKEGEKKSETTGGPIVFNCGPVHT
jgi:hypothetical protein